MNILIVEDDFKVGNFLKENLLRDNHAVNLVTSIPELEEFWSLPNERPEVIILDRLLGNTDTRSYLKEIKRKFNASKIIYLSALNSPQEKANLLDEGVDDYLGKPFSLVELQARVRALGRRSDVKQESLYLTIGDVTIDLKTRSILCQSRRIDLSNKEYSLFLNLAQNECKVFSKYQLLDIIWEANLDIESNVLEVTMMNLRKKLSDGHSTIKILSKRNVGYWLES